ncbi:hypothetical protein GCM10027299_03370 [Larkinella ripae]
MARPSRNNADYFPHNADFRNDRRVKAIRAQFGVSGYGILMMLMEVLTDAEFTQLNTDDLELDLLAGDLGVSVTDIRSLLQFAERISLFARNTTGHLICTDLNKGLEQVFEKRNRARIAAQQAKERVSVTETPDSVTESTQRKEKEKKEDNTSSVADATNCSSSGKDKPQKDYTLTHKIRLAIEEKYPDYYWDAKDGAHAKKCGVKLQTVAKNRLSRDPTDSESIDTLKWIFAESETLGPYYHFQDMASFNTNFNKIVNQIRRRSSVSQTSQPIRRSPNEIK